MIQLAIALISNSIIFFLIGVIYERSNWNVLIDKGILPKPKNKTK